MYRLNRKVEILASAGAIVAGAAVLGCSLYCLLWYRTDEPSLLIPDVGLLCWLFCGTMNFIFGALAVLSGLLLLGAGALTAFGKPRSGAVLAIFWGLTAFPVGLLAILPGLVLLLRVRIPLAEV